MLDQIKQRVYTRALAFEDGQITVLSKLVSINTADPLGEKYDQSVVKGLTH
jgi:hypothetical protein